MCWRFAESSKDFGSVSKHRHPDSSLCWRFIKWLKDFGNLSQHPHSDRSMCWRFIKLARISGCLSKHGHPDSSICWRFINGTKGHWPPLQSLAASSNTRTEAFRCVGGSSSYQRSLVASPNSLLCWRFVKLPRNLVAFSGLNTLWTHLTTSYCKILLSIFGKKHSRRKSFRGASPTLWILGYQISAKSCV